LFLEEGKLLAPYANLWTRHWDLGVVVVLFVLYLQSFHSGSAIHSYVEVFDQDRLCWVIRGSPFLMPGE
jgi:hypothetical protein